MKFTWRNWLLALLIVVAFATVSVRADSDEADVEDDDFEPAFAAPRSEPKPTTPPQARGVKWNTLTVDDFHFEIGVVAILGLYGVVALLARQKAGDFAKNWYRITSDIWEQNFAHTGADKAKLVRDGPRDYIFFASGRAHVLDMYTFIHTAARLDPIQYLYDYINPQEKKDRLTYYIRLHKEESDPIVFAIIPKDNVQKFTKDRWDLTEFPKKQTLPNFPHSHYTVLTDAPEFTTQLWEDPEIRKAIFASIGLDAEGNGEAWSEGLIESVVLSDLPYLKPEKMEELQLPKLLKFEFRAPKEAGLVQQQARFVLDVVDYIGQLGKLSAEGRAKAKKRREFAEGIVLKLAEEERKKELADKKIKERKAIADEMAKRSPEEQRKWEEKEKKKQQKKQAKSMVKSGRVMV
ncbi:hypothetical protein HK097_001548 [Rhizophlyctis rosea]|uniref:DUF1682-domain-containing protein n=1 Tax=Rhizophlyctis rosea TaxID=64517 RepID=A0AAD5X1T4_9FUNG|nr:hypothetical protein HK097_001548 [Rhizophlyctis rosea]